MTLGSRIKELRQRRGLTQAQLAERLGMTEANISNYERGVSTPPYTKLNLIAEVLNVPVSELTGEKSEGVSYFNLTNTEKDFLILARHVESIPDEEKEKLKQTIQDTIELYLARAKKKKD